MLPESSCLSSADIALAATRGRLRWRARRGLLENDLIISRFLDQYEQTLTNEEIAAFLQLMECADNELLDLFLMRTASMTEQDSPVMQTLLAKLRMA